MKKISIVVIISSLSMLLYFFSCSRSNNDSISETSKNVYSSKQLVSRLADTGGVTFECKGSCGCFFRMDMNTMKGECSCDTCVLDLHFNKSTSKLNNKVTDKDKIISSVISDDFTKKSLNDFKSYSLKSYKKQVEEFTKVDYFIDNDKCIIVLYFKDSDNKEQTVMYAKNFKYSQSRLPESGGGGFRVDCQGGCGCREQFDFNTNTASCSCSDCTMTVTPIK